jgi:hypothetical protein
MASYCNQVCQRAHFKQHKKVCGWRELPEEYPQSTLDDLRAAFPHHTVIDGADVTLSSLLGWVEQLQKDATKMLVVIRKRSATHVTPSDLLFQTFGVGPPAPEDPTALISALGVSSAIMVFHKDVYYHLSKQPLPVLIRFLRRRITTSSEQEPAGDCPVCLQPLAENHAHRIECTDCGMRVCNTCVAGIIQSRPDKRYMCPGCRDQPKVVLYEQIAVPLQES